ncbi:glucosamine-6-phosphate deaminase [Flavihumibacter sp. RY-1]|uniref:Glucosamine-6-phosphate deaminase n=1 Tax=Flavihumibacter fluminis TaxID=2909236 RepID=A0ABS9BLC4_9BACT|nr:glucosamine-6-phosphate deaminase [Flavihumibacter fluminis]MCF1715644.1 glucosamine-6-phosphate deaminase [Flavihumibacter fluminis]
MQVHIQANATELGKEAGRQAAAIIQQAIQEKGQANIILATGASQFETLRYLVNDKDIQWSSVVAFHLDEYIGMPDSHPASFRKYLRERFIDQVTPLKEIFLINGETNQEAECQRLSDAIAQYPIDLALVGIGENGHLAFNDPPADFDTKSPYIIVNLDEACRRQQMGEGWFQTLEEVPSQAISMSVHQIMQAKHIICSVPDKRKAEAVRNSLKQAVSNLYPSSILQNHPNCDIYLDQFSASLL